MLSLTSDTQCTLMCMDIEKQCTLLCLYIRCILLCPDILCTLLCLDIRHTLLCLDMRCTLHFWLLGVPCYVWIWGVPCYVWIVKWPPTLPYRWICLPAEGSTRLAETAIIQDSGHVLVIAMQWQAIWKLPIVLIHHSTFPVSLGDLENGFKFAEIFQFKPWLSAVLNSTQIISMLVRTRSHCSMLPVTGQRSLTPHCPGQCWVTAKETITPRCLEQYSVYPCNWNIYSTLSGTVYCLPMELEHLLHAVWNSVLFTHATGTFTPRCLKQYSVPMQLEHLLHAVPNSIQ